jgi:hypothetical protein
MGAILLFPLEPAWQSGAVLLYLQTTLQLKILSFEYTSTEPLIWHPEIWTDYKSGCILNWQISSNDFVSS